MEDSLEIVRRHRFDGSLLNDRHRIAEHVLAELGVAGYWGLRVEPQYGGVGSSMGSLIPFLTRMSVVHPAVAGLAAVHSCLGAVDSIRAFGSDDQKRRWLPGLREAIGWRPSP